VVHPVREEVQQRNTIKITCHECKGKNHVVRNYQSYWRWREWKVKKELKELKKKKNREMRGEENKRVLRYTI